MDFTSDGFMIWPATEKESGLGVTPAQVTLCPLPISMAGFILVPHGPHDEANGPVGVILAIGEPISLISVLISGNDLLGLCIGDFVTVCHLCSPSSGGPLARGVRALVTELRVSSSTKWAKKWADRKFIEGSSNPTLSARGLSPGFAEDRELLL